MNHLRSFSKGVAVSLLLIVLLATPLFMALQATVNSPETVKASLSKSNIYDTVTKTDLLLGDSHLSSAALADQGVEAALSSAIMPSYVQASSEKLIDASYAYIWGNTASLDLSVDIGDAKTRFADSIASYVRQKFESLPRCQELKIPSTSIESLLEATCAPVGVSSRQASDYARQEILGTALFSNDRLEIAGLVGARESVLQSYADTIRAMYPYFISLVYILPIASVVLALGVIFLSSTRRRGVKIIANVLMTAGIINGLVAFVVMGLAGFILGDGSQAEVAAAGSLEVAASDILTSLRMWWLGLAGLFIAVSSIAYVVLRASRPPHPTPTSAKLEK